MSTRIQSTFARFAGGVLLLGSALLLPASVAAQHFPSEEDVSVMLRYLVEDGETPAIVLGFIEADGSTTVVSYGDGGPGTMPIGPRSAFEIGSITKTFTATLLADMVQRGEMALDDPVAQYLPEGVTMPSRGFDDDIGADFLRRGPPLAIPEVDVDPEILEAYVGQYEMAPGRRMVIRLEDNGTMTLQAPDNVRFRLYAESDSKFFVKRTPWRVTFTRDASGNVDGVVADFEGNELTGRKVSDETPPPAVVAGNDGTD